MYTLVDVKVKVISLPVEYSRTSATWRPVKSTAKVTPITNSQSASSIKDRLSSQSQVNINDAPPIGNKSTNGRAASAAAAAVEHADTENAAGGSVKTEYKGSVLGESNKENIQVHKTSMVINKNNMYMYSV